MIDTLCFREENPVLLILFMGQMAFGSFFLNPLLTTKKVEESASEFLVNKLSEFPGEVSVLALGPLTNVALVCLQATVIGLNLFIVQSMLCYML